MRKDRTVTMLHLSDKQGEIGFQCDKVEECIKLQCVRDAKRHTKKSAKPSNLNFLTNQRPATEILTNGITWREIHFGFWTNQRTIDISFSIPIKAYLILKPE